MLVKQVAITLAPGNSVANLMTLHTIEYPSRIILTWLLGLLILFLPGMSTAQSICASSQNQTPLKGLYFKPVSVDNTFWQINQDFADAVAADLNIALQTVVIGRDMSNRIMFAELLEEHIDAQNPPDFIVSVLYAGGEATLIRKLNEFAIPFFTVNTSIGKNTLELVGYPRQNLPYWKAHMSPDEQYSAGVLLEEMHKLSKGKNVLAIAGHNQSAVNHQRLKGLRDKATELKLSLAPPIFTDWSKGNAMLAARTLFQRVQQHDMVWTAGPSIASAVADLIAQEEQYQQENILVGTFDWSAEAIELVKQGAVQLTYGGHFMEAGWLLVMAHDYLHGADFAEHTGTLISSKLRRMDKSNVLSIEKMVNDKNWQAMDFRQYSQCYNLDSQPYDFRLKK